MGANRTRTVDRASGSSLVCASSAEPPGTWPLGFADEGSEPFARGKLLSSQGPGAGCELVVEVALHAAGLSTCFAGFSPFLTSIGHWSRIGALGKL